MDYSSFLPHFITEDVYLIKEHIVPKTDLSREVNPDPLVLTPQDITPEEDQFLNKVFSAAKLDPASIDRQVVTSKIDPHRKYLFFFGKAPVSLDPYQVTIRGDQIMVLADELSEIAHDQVKKRKLWAVLQQVFN